MNLKIVFAVLFAAVTTVQGQDPIPAKESRAKAEKLRGQGNWKDALNLHRELLEKHDDSQSGKDLKDAVNELQRLNLGEGLDELVESAVNAHGENWGLLQEASSAYWHVQHWGYILDGEFKRGHHRGGGRHVSSMGRDRVRAIQLGQRPDTHHRSRLGL